VPNRDQEVVRIAGAGPAGLACAIALAQQGRAVEIYERRIVAGSRFSGGHQVLAAYGEKPTGVQLLGELGVDIERLEGRWLRKARFLDASGKGREFTSQKSFAYLLRRGAGARTLDAALLERARELSVVVRTGRRLQPSDADVDATGPARIDGMALEILYDTGAANRVDVLLEPNFFAGGYAYLFIFDHVATLGIAVLGDFKNLEKHAEHALCRFVELEPFDREERSRAKYHMCYGLPRTAQTAKTLIVGEAAGFQDFLFGLGLRNTMLSGCIAASSLMSNSSYDEQWRRELSARMRASEVDRWLYGRGWLGWLLAHSHPRHLDRSLEWLHGGSRWRAPFARWVGGDKGR
jgi:flavin-dependent dehydrogenase